MFTCPNNSIHSVYLDNELTPPYSTQYEAHIKECKKCSQKLEVLKKMRAFVKSSLNEFPSVDIESSWERLQLKQRYVNNTKSESQKSPTLKTWLPLAAAAAFLAIVLPFRTSQVQNKNIATTIVPVTRQSSVQLTKKNVIINGNIEPGYLCSVSNASFTDNDFLINLDNADVFKPNIQSDKVNVRIILPEQSFIANMPIAYNESR